MHQVTAGHRHAGAPRRLPITLAIIALSNAAFAALPEPTDILRFGDGASEQAHGLTADASESAKGALGQPARRFLPLGQGDWRGGSASFRLKVSADASNYLSVRLWGGDVNGNQATLYCDGKQLGYRHASDIDILDQGTKYPVAPGRFHYVTHPLPRALTQGKSEIGCRLRVTGPIWRYGGDFATFQKPMTEPSRQFYALIVHGDKMVPLDQVEGRAPAAPRLAQSAESQAAVLERVRKRVNGQVEKMWTLTRPANQLEISFLAKTFDTGWTLGHGSAKNLAGIVGGIDAMWDAYKKDRQIAYYDKATPNEGWFGFGLIGQALKITGPRLQHELDGKLKGADGGEITRRAALEIMFADSLEWNKQHRRMYTNQSMIKDLYGIWYNNEGLIAIGSAKADPRAKLLPFFYESVGLRPWTGSLNALGEPTYASAEADAKFAVDKAYYLATPKGLTKELGYVGGYGEVLDWVVDIYNATRPAKGQDGDKQIRDQLVRLAQARAWFRYPHWDEHGNRAMRLEAAIGWRDVYFPGDTNYGQRGSWDASPLQSAVATRAPSLVAYAQQMIADNQLFPTIEHMLEAPSLRATIGLIEVVDEFAAIERMPSVRDKLPMSPGQPDFVFADEEDGVVAIKRGDEILYASLYWRANYGVSSLARVHYVTLATDRTATVKLDRQEFEASGMFFTRPNNPHINGSRFSIRYPEDGDVWTAGEQQPVAKLPAGSRYVAGEDNAHAGRADYYELRYGPYLIAMNSSTDKQFTVSLPAHKAAVKDLVSGVLVQPGVAAMQLKPGSTAIFYLVESK